MGKSCCGPAGKGNLVLSDGPTIARGEPDNARDCVIIPAGRAYLGTRHPQLVPDGEGPMRRRVVERFQMDRTTVTTARFAAFVEATGYVSEAEKIGWSFVFHHQLPADYAPTRGVAGLEWWRGVPGASWRCLLGQGDTIAQTADHPVVHVSLADARAFAQWAGGRLASEPEWEHAARGGLGDVRFPWGDDEPDDESVFPCNIWQGQFPHDNLALDGFAATAPADSFAPNGYGLMNMVGNVWEWTADMFVNDVMRRRMAKRITPEQRSQHLLKGGSFLCHKSYCYRYRIAARTGNTPDFASTHTGFRLVYPA